MTDSDVPGRVYTQIGPWGLVPVWILDPAIYLPGAPDQTKIKDESLKLRDGDKKPLTGSELRVYIALRSFSNHAGESNPFVKTIAARACVERNTAEKALAKFKRLGWLTTKRRYRDPEKRIIHRCDYYLIDVPPAPRETPPHPDPEVTTEDPPSSSREGSPPDGGEGPLRAEGAINTPEEPTTETRNEANRSDSARCAPEVADTGETINSDDHSPSDAPIPEDDQPGNWRIEDKDLLRSILGEQIRLRGGVKGWRKGVFPTDAVYDALRVGYNEERKPVKWPGRYVARISSGPTPAGLENWLDEQGFDLVDRDMQAAA